MTKTSMICRAAVALVASAAFPAAAVLAQDAAPSQPVIVLPDIAPDASSGVPAKPTANPAPAIVVPQTQTGSSAPSPIILPDPAPAVSDGVPPVARNPAEPVAPATPKPVVNAATRKAPAALSGTRQAAKTTASAGVNPAAAGTEAVPAEQTFVAPVDGPVTSPGLPPDSMPGALAPQPAAPVSSAQMDDAAIFGLAGALGLLAIGGMAFAAMRRRRAGPSGAEMRTDYAAQPADARGEMVVEPKAVPLLARASSPAATRIAPPIADAGYARHPLARVDSSGSIGDPVALPPEVPESFEERDALLKKLIAAKPDRANPFRSQRARAHRAKLIIQSLNRRFEHTKPRIDLSQYSNRWPALRGWRPATA